MKWGFKPFLAGVIAAVASVGLAMTVYASDGGYDVEYAVLEDGRATITATISAEDIDFAAAVSDRAFSGDSYSTQLDDESLKVYDMLLEAYSEGTNLNTYVFADDYIAEDVTLQKIDGDVYIDSSASQKFFAWAEDIYTPALTAVLFDHPELSWLVNSGLKYGYTVSYTTFSGTSSVQDLSFTPLFYFKANVTDSGTPTDIDTAVAKAQAVINAGLPDNASRYDILKGIHDYVVSTIEYYHDVADDVIQDESIQRLCQTVYSAFYPVNGDEILTVCAGYAKCYKVLCDSYDITCVLVTGEASGEAHLWNYVQMEDEKWYGVDCTWDDQSVIRYDFFLIGSDETPEHFNSGKFSESHVNGDYFTGYPLNYPVLSDCYYEADSTVYLPYSPENVVAVGGDGCITLTWDAVDHADRYAVAIYSGGTYTTKVSNLTTTSYTLTGLTNGTEYTLIVLSNVGGKWSDTSSEYHVKATPSAPKPTNIKATAGDAKVSFTWTGVTGATRYSLSIYNPDTEKYTLVSSQITGTSYTATGLTNGKEYQFLIRAYVNGEWSAYTSADFVKATPVSTKPTNIKATAGDGKDSFTWTGVTGAERYSLSIYNPDTGKYTLRSSQITKTTYTTSGLTNGKEYVFLIRAYVNGAWSSYTTADFVKATPYSTKPANIKATAGDGKVTFTWTAVAGATRYSLSIYNPDTGKYTLRSSQITRTTYTASALTNGKEYQFLIRANVNGVWSPYTSADFIKVTPVAAKPSNIKATAGNGKVSFTWTGVAGATRYSLSIYNPDTGKYTLRSSQITKTSYTTSALTNGKEYQFLIRAYVNGAWSPYTTADFVKVTPTASSPYAKATVGNGKVTLTWNLVDGAERYAVAQYSDGKYTTKVSTLTSTSYTLSGLTNGTEYTFVVLAYKDGKWSSSSSIYHVKATPSAA